MPPSRFCEETPKEGVSVLRAEWKRCKLKSWQWYASSHSIYQVNDEKPATRNQDRWWLCLVVCNAKRGAAELHWLVIPEICRHHSRCRSRSVFPSCKWCKINSVQHISKSGDVCSMRPASSSYGSLHWVHKVESPSGNKKWYRLSRDGDESG